jgi:hypothetical protein
MATSSAYNQFFFFSQDTFTPMIDKMLKNAKSTAMRSFMQTQTPILKQNVDESFRRQVYFGGTEQPWDALATYTKTKRMIKGTWYGEANSTLKETFRMFNRIKAGGSVGKTATGAFFARLSTTDRIALIHQYGNDKIPKRPPYSLLAETQVKLVTNAVKFLLG